MSRPSVATPNKQAIKKAQGGLKTLISTYGSLMLSWNNDVEEVQRLLQYMKDLISKRKTIENCISSKSFFTRYIENSHTIGGLLISMIIRETESALMQIRTFE